jgi:hypothetical protein
MPTIQNMDYLDVSHLFVWRYRKLEDRSIAKSLAITFNAIMKWQISKIHMTCKKIG